LGMANRALPTTCGVILGDVSRCGQNV
jgi:hypothetical protein